MDNSVGYYIPVFIFLKETLEVPTEGRWEDDINPPMYSEFLQFLHLEAIEVALDGRVGSISKRKMKRKWGLNWFVVNCHSL